MILLLLPLAGPLLELGLVHLKLLNNGLGLDELLVEGVALVSVQCLPDLRSVQLLTETDDLLGSIPSWWTT